MRLDLKTLVGIYYYLAALALTLVGVTLWSTGHGNGDPYLTLGIVLALGAGVVLWLRRRRR